MLPRRRWLLASAVLAVPVHALAAIVGPTPASARIRHRLAWLQMQGLAGRTLTGLPPDAPLHADFRRLLGRSYARFAIGLGVEEPMHRIGDAIVGEGVRPGTLGAEASLFVLGKAGGMFAVTRSGAFGADVVQFGDPVLLDDWNVKHRVFEFMDIDE